MISSNTVLDPLLCFLGKELNATYLSSKAGIVLNTRSLYSALLLLSDLINSANLFFLSSSLLISANSAGDLAKVSKSLITSRLSLIRAAKLLSLEPSLVKLARKASSTKFLAILNLSTDLSSN